MLQPHPRVATFLLITAMAWAGGRGGALAASGPTQSSAAGPKLLRDVMAGRDLMRPKAPEQGDTTIEPSIAVNPENELNAVAVYQEGRVDGGGDQDNGFATTFDGGRTWHFGNLPGLTWDVGGHFDRASDAVVAFGPGNVVYANSLVFDDGSESGTGLRSGLAVNVSHDGGRTWGPPVTFVDDRINPLNDKNWIVADTSGAPGHHKGRVYVLWDTGSPVWGTYSDDEGLTWTPRFIVFLGQGIGVYPLVLPNGDLVVSFEGVVPQRGEGGELPAGDQPTKPDQGLEPLTIDNIVMVVAVGAGAVPTGLPLLFTPPIKVAEYQGNDVRQFRDGGLIAAAVDPRTGRVYVAWEDGRFREDHANDAVLAWSDDEGLTWSPVTRVNPGPVNDWVDRWDVDVGVGADGVVHVAYRLRHEAADLSKASWLVDTFYQESVDGGASFTPPMRLNSVRTDLRFAALSREQAFLGDYTQLAVVGKQVYIVRCEALPVRGKAAKFPPVSHHQMTYVAVISA
jgi:hypothetical protein